MKPQNSKPSSVSIGCPDGITVSVHESILSYLKTALPNGKRAAVLLNDKLPDGMLAGTYWPKPFPVDSAAIKAVQKSVDPRFINKAKTLCCVALPPPYNEYLYVEANPGERFQRQQPEILAGVASIAIGLHDASAKNAQAKPASECQPRIARIARI